MNEPAHQHRVRFEFQVDFPTAAASRVRDSGSTSTATISTTRCWPTTSCGMRLLIVGAVRILYKTIIRERHKRQPQTAAGDVAAGCGHPLPIRALGRRIMPSRSRDATGDATPGVVQARMTTSGRLPPAAGHADNTALNRRPDDADTDWLGEPSCLTTPCALPAWR
ncbi:hypothetical protein [Rhodanobacter lindaniclasticus]